MQIRYEPNIYEAPDLPITSASICTCCGQLLDSNERIGLPTKVEFQPDPEPDPTEVLDFETWINWHGTWIEYCPHCYCLFSVKPPRPVIIIDAEVYPEIEDLIEKRDRLQERAHIHKGNLRRLEEKLAMAGPLSSSSLWLENSIDHEKKQVLTVERELHRVGEEIQNRLTSSLK